MFAELARAFRAHPVAAPLGAAAIAFAGARLARPDGCVPSTLGTLLGTVGVVGVGLAGMGVATRAGSTMIGAGEHGAAAVLRGNPSLSMPAKLGIGALVVGGGLFAYERSANAQSMQAPGGPGDATFTLHGDFRTLVAGDVVTLPGTFHLRAAATVNPAAGDRELPAQAVRITGPGRADVVRGPREMLYPVVVVGSGAAGFAWIPDGARRRLPSTG